MVLKGGRIGPDLVLYNGKVVTVDRDFSIKQAIVVLDGKIVAVGDNSLRDMAVSGTRMVDLRGRTVSPGMTDNHTHLILAGLEHPPGVRDGRGVPVKAFILDKPSIEGIKGEIKKLVDVTPPGEWVVTSCMYRGELREGRFLNRYDLDEVSDRHPIYVMQSGKNIIVNSRALKVAEVTRHTPNPMSPEGHIVRDEHGEPTGHMIAGAGDLVRKRVMRALGKRNIMWDMLVYPLEVKEKAIRNMMGVANACGIVGTRDMGVSPDEIEAYQGVHGAGGMTVRVNLILGLPSRYLTVTEIRESLESYFGPKQRFGDEWLSVGGLKIVMRNDSYWSLDPEKVKALVELGNRYNFALITHIDSGGGEDAAEWFLELLEEADRVNPINGRRFCIEHMLPAKSREALDKVRRLGMIISASNLVCYFAAARSFKMSKVMDQVKISKMKGEEDPWARAVRDWGLPLRDWVDMGIVVTCGSDCPAVPYDPEHPFIGFYSAVTGDTLAGVLLPGQQVTRQEAMRMYTINYAYSTFEEGIKGSIEPGKLADFTVYTEDIMAVPDEKLKDVKVAMTIVGGKVVYEG